MTTTSARELIDRSPMRALQIAAVAITVGLNALDGFDVLSISFASPGIAKEFGIDRAALGAVLSMELIGMAIGSIALGGLADRIGRRPSILGCLVVMAIGMFGVTTAHGLVPLSAWRVLTGLGIGGMLASINAVAAEYANAKWKTLALAIMVIGYPLGAVIGGSIAAVLLKSGDWRAIFEFGAVVTACFIPIVFFFIPETPSYLEVRRPPGALERINRTLRRIGHRELDALAAIPPVTPRAGPIALFTPQFARLTTIVTFAYFTHILTFYFLAKWTPKIVVDMGFVPALAAGVLVWVNVGGAIGGGLFGLLSAQVGLKRLTLVTLALSVVTVIVFGGSAANLSSLKIVACAAGFATNATICGLYSIFARAFPTELRATGTGFAVGVGRGGSAVAPYLAGVLFQRGLGLQTVAIIMAMGSLMAFFAILTLNLPDGDAKAIDAA
jgi:benzoate transport